MLPNREGLYHAYPTQIGIDETGPNKLATCIVNFRLYEELQQSGEWADCSGDGYEITGYFYLEKKDGSLNTVSLEALKNALGWDGRDPFYLQETDLSRHAVQVKLAYEEYGGKTRLKVQYLNPHGSTGGGGVPKADDTTRRAIVNRLNSKLRAMAGPAPAAKPGVPKTATPTPAASPDVSPAAPVAPATPKLPPAKPRVRPKPAPPPVAAPIPAAPSAAPAPRPSSAAPSPEAPVPADPHAATMDEAWAEFCSHCPADKWDQAAIANEWFRILAAMFPGRQPDQLTPAEWAAMRDEGAAKIIPF